jgi:hypothetical protein
MLREPWRPYEEPLRATLLRTITIAVVVGGVAVHWWGGLARWPAATLLALWPSFGGHWVELWFLNWLRPRLAAARSVQVGARFGVWFAGGALLTLGMLWTAVALGRLPGGRWPLWWAAVGGAAFIGVELVAQLLLQLRGRPSFYNGRG